MTTGHRAERITQLLILLLVGGMAGAASFTHVHDWTMQNSPAGTGGWFGWANAIISELTPTAVGLEIRRRKTQNRPVAYPMVVLIAAAALSLTAQIAEAKWSPTGWLVAAVPALASLALTKLVLSGTTIPASPGTTAAGRQDQISEPVPEPISPHLLTGARMAAFSYRQTTGHDITTDALASHLAIPHDLAGHLLHALDDTADQANHSPSPVTHLNGTPLTGSRP